MVIVNYANTFGSADVLIVSHLVTLQTSGFSSRTFCSAMTYDLGSVHNVHKLPSCDFGALLTSRKALFVVAALA